MGLFSRTPQAVVPVSGDAPEGVSGPSLQEVINDYDLISVQPDYMVVSPKGYVQLADAPVTTEIGGYGASSYYAFSRQDYNPAMAGQLGLRRYDEMRRSDSQVRRSLNVIKTPVQAARWYMEPASESEEDKKIADFVWDCYTKYMSVSFPQLLRETLTFLDFGWYALEKVPEFRVIDGKQMVVWKKLAPRHPLDSLGGWSYDSHGGPTGCWFMGDGGDEVFIPIEKLLAFTYDKEAGNMDGISVLRTAYKNWYFKDNLYKIDAIQKERHGIGIPIIKLPPNFSEADRVAAEHLGANLRTNEKAHVVLPPGWEILFAKLEGQPVNCMESIEHHNGQILGNIMAEFLGMGSSGNDDAAMDMFVKGTRFIADIVRDVHNKWAIPELVNWNFPNVDAYPELKVRRIGDTTDWRVLSFALRNLVGANILQVDDRLEHWIRDEMDLPRVDLETLRPVATPQAPSKAPVGLPRQAVASKMKVAPGGASVGKDSSGTSTGGAK